MRTEANSQSLSPEEIKKDILKRIRTYTEDFLVTGGHKDETLEMVLKDIESNKARLVGDTSFLLDIFDLFEKQSSSDEQWFYKKLIKNYFDFYKKVLMILTDDKKTVEGEVKEVKGSVGCYMAWKSTGVANS